MIDKKYINSIIDEVNKIEIGSLVTITKDDETDIYKVQFDEFQTLELISISKNDTIWNDYENLDEAKEDLICNAIRNRYESIKVRA